MEGEVWLPSPETALWWQAVCKDPSGLFRGQAVVLQVRGAGDKVETAFLLILSLAGPVGRITELAWISDL